MTQQGWDSVWRSDGLTRPDRTGRVGCSPLGDMVAPEEDEATPRSVTTGSSCSSCVKLFTVAMTDVDYLVPSCSATDRAQRFDREHLRRLRAFAYRMLGSRAEAEDIVQEAWLRWAEVDERTVANVGAYLSRVVTHLSLDRLRSASLQREQYIGVWLPEPWLDDPATIDEAPSPEQQAEFSQDV